jgi:hypothetical protein
MGFMTSMMGVVVGSLLTLPKDNHSAADQQQSTPVLRSGADLLYYNTNLDPNQRVFGFPGASLHHAQLDDVSALEAGIEGERRVAAELERLAAYYPNTYVFHSVKMPGRIGDMDHIVVQGTRALLVDSKNWRRNASYDLAEMYEEGDIVLRDGSEFPGGEIHLRKQLVDWQVLFMESDVHMSAALVVANNVSSVNQSVDTGYVFTNINGLADTFSRVFDAGYVGPLSDEMLRYYCNMVQDPNFNPADERNYITGSNIVTVPAAVKKPSTKLTKWLVFWSFMNYITLPFFFPLAGISAIPLITIATRHLDMVKSRGLGGRGLLTTVLVFSYILLAVWALGVALVLAYYFIYPHIMNPTN